MRRIFIGCVLIVMLVLGCTTEPGPPFRVMSFNVRIDLRSDGENAWLHRRPRVDTLLTHHTPHILGVQEALAHQVRDLNDMLPMHDWYGIGREDGLAKGEFMAIFYDTSRFSLVRSGTFWLSETPEVPGKGWDADWIRTASWGVLTDGSSGRDLFLLNTHLDNRGEQARLKGAELIMERIPVLAEGLPVLLMGDLNCPPGSAPHEVIEKGSFLKNSSEVSLSPPRGSRGTYTAFDLRRDVSDEAPIDHIFTSLEFQVMEHATIDMQVDGQLPSDHFPVMISLALQ